MKKINYLLFVCITLVLGILSRKINGIPLFIGDILYAIFIYFGLRTTQLFSMRTTMAISLFFCFCIEFSQLLHWHWLQSIRNTTLGHYVLGEGFLISDLICYSIGTILAYLIDTKLLNR
ncbi:DUF2809 domain-containing protein [Flavobacterium sp.]|uniref:ribosomal maturation YjgA family protein n=1 Tax=Flavobacterium sp. TaxID=239 RepID=UPI0035288A8A